MVDQATPRRVRAPELVGLAVIVVAGWWLRLVGVTSLGLWRDDAWVAMGSRVSTGTALRMGATAPGFTLIERWWILLHPGSSSWAQALPVALGLIGIVTMFALARYLGLGAWLSLATAAFVALSPVTISYSTHVKQYSADIVLSCALLGLGELARRRPGRRHLALLAVASVVGLVISASVAVVVVGVWAMLALTTFHQHDRLGEPDQPGRRNRVLMAGALTALACGVVGLALYGHLSSALHLFWSQQHRFLEATPAHKVVPQLASLGATAVLKMPTAAWVSTPIGIVVTALALVGLTAGAKVWSSSLALAAALVAAALGVIPWGTGRTDMVVYPALALLVAFGIDRLVRAAARPTPAGSSGSSKSASSARSAAPGVRVAAAVATVVVLVGLVAMARTDVVRPAKYPAVNASHLMHEVAAHERPGDLVFVSSSSRYPWVLQSPDRPRLVFGTGWGAGYTVVSTRSDQFLAPSYSWETGFHPTQWARHTTGARRLWFVGGGYPPSRRDQEYRALLAVGWRPVGVLRAKGCVAVLMTRG